MADETTPGQLSLFAPEALLPRCTEERWHGVVRPLTDARRHEILAEGAAFAATETQPQFSTSMPRAMTEPAATRNTTSSREITSAASRFQAPARSSRPATSSIHGSVTATTLDGTGPPTCHW